MRRKTPFSVMENYSLPISGEHIHYSLKRSTRRRSIGLTISETGCLRVSAPKSTPLSRVEGVLRDKLPWIQRQLTRIKKLRATLGEPGMVSGRKILFMGDSLDMTIDVCRERPGVYQHEKILAVHLDEEPQTREEKQALCEKLVEAWYRLQASEILPERLKHFANQMRLFPEDLLIKHQQHRWGSCSPDGIIRLNWRLVMAPLPVIDYVIVHELAHLNQMNHGPAFWRLVSSTLPGYATQKKWLRDNTALLTL